MEMDHAAMSRRGWLRISVAACAVLGFGPRQRALAATEIKLPDSAPVEMFDFESKGIDGWTTLDGQWAVEEMAGAPSGQKVLVQRATKNEFNVIVAPAGPYS